MGMKVKVRIDDSELEFEGDVTFAEAAEFVDNFYKSSVAAMQVSIDKIAKGFKAANDKLEDTVEHAQPAKENA